jgi:hypothetical protein
MRTLLWYYEFMSSTLSFLEEMHAEVTTREFSLQEVAFLIEVLQVGAFSESSLACVIFSYLEKDQVLIVLEKFESFPLPVQLNMVYFMASMEFFEPYMQLLTLLKKSLPKALEERIILCLGKAEYPVVPLVGPFLEEKDALILYKYKQVLAHQGIHNAALYLQFYRPHPHESVFREVYGDVAVDSIL